MEIDVSQRLKTLREEHGWTHDDVSLKTNLSANRIRSFEKGTKVPKPYEARILCDLFDVSYPYIIGLTDKRKIEEHDFLQLIESKLSVPERLTVLRYYNGWTVSEVSRMTKIRSDTLSSYESGAQIVPSASALKLSSIYHIPVSYICDTADREDEDSTKPVTETSSGDSYLRQLRKQRGLTIAEAATLMGIWHLTLCFYETGSKKVNHRYIPKLAEFYQVSPEELKRKMNQYYNSKLGCSGPSNPKDEHNHLRQLRLENILTVTEVAEKTGLSHSAISNYETGQRIPKKTAAERLAAFYGVSVDYIRGKSEYRGSYIPQKSDAHQTNHLRALRLQKNWTLEQAAQRIGITRVYLCKLEKGKHIVTEAMAQKCAEAYGVPVTAVVGPDTPIMSDDDPSKAEKCMSTLNEGSLL